MALPGRRPERLIPGLIPAIAARCDVIMGGLPSLKQG